MGTNKKNKMSIELEANVDIEVEIEAEVEVEVVVDAEAEVEVEIDAGLEVEIEVQEEAVVEIEVDIEAPELAVECELALDVNVEENLVANEQGGSVEDLSAHGTQKIIWLVVMIVCMLDLLVTVPYLGWAIYAIIMVYGQSGFHGATAASCWITLIFVALFVAVGVIVLLISLKKWKQAKDGEAAESGPITVVTYEQAPAGMGEVGGEFEVELEIAADVEVELDCEAEVEIELGAPEVEIELEVGVEVEVEVEAEVEVEVEIEA